MLVIRERFFQEGRYTWKLSECVDGTRCKTQPRACVIGRFDLTHNEMFLF